MGWRFYSLLDDLPILQEILGDLHAGQFGRAPERRQAAEEAQRRWERLSLGWSGNPVEREGLITVLN